MLLLALLDTPISGADLTNLYKLNSGEPFYRERVYVTLQRLRDKGWVYINSGKDPNTANGKMYRRTKAGTRAVELGRQYYETLSKVGE